MTFKHLFKCTIVGDANTGKTCLLNQFTTSNFDAEYDVSIDFPTTKKDTKISNNQVSMEIVDTPGFHIFRDQVCSHLFKTKAIATFVVYDVTNRQSFANANGWVSAVKRHCMKNEVIMLVANKVDKEDRQVTTEEGLIFAKQNGLRYCETSANEQASVQVCFESVATDILSNEELVKKCIRADSFEAKGSPKSNKTKGRAHKRNLIEMIFGIRN